MRLATLAGWVIVLLGLAIHQSTNALVLIIVARRVAPIEYGQYLSCYGLASLLIVLPNAGLDALLLARGSAGIAAMSHLWKGAVRLRLQLLLVWLVLMVLLGFYLPTDAYPPFILFPTALGLACDSLALLSYSALRGLNHHEWVTITQLLAASVLLGGTLIWPFGPGQIILFSSLRALLSTIVAVVVIIMVQRFLQQRTGTISVRTLLKEAFPYFLAEASISTYTKADLTIVSLFLGPGGSSIYGPALSIINMSFIVPNALYFYMLPLLVKFFTTDQQRFVRVSVVQLGMQALAGIMVAAFMFWLAPMTIRQVFGSEYVSSIRVLQMLSPILVFKSLNFGLAAIITAANLQPWRTTIQMVCAFFNIVANLVVIGSLGLLGVVSVYVLSEALLFTGYTWVGYRRLCKA